MHLLTLAQQAHVYGFEGRTAQYIFVAGFAALAVIAVLVTKMSLKNILFGAIIFSTCIAPAVDDILVRYNPTWMLYVQQHHAEVHLIGSLLLSTIALVAGWFHTRNFSIQGVLVLVAAVYAGSLQLIHDDVSEALQAIGFAIATIPCFMVAMGAQTHTFQGCLDILKVLMGVSVAWTFCCSVQFVIDPQYLVSYQGRFLGMLANAQHAAVFVAVSGIIATWLFLHYPQKRSKILWLAILAINLLFLAWTASRTGALMFVVGLVFVLYARIGKAVVLLPIAAGLVWLLAWLAAALQIGANLERFISTENTREGVLTSQLNGILENPLIGVGWRGSGVGSENSYLGGFAAYGILYFLLTISLLIASVWQCARFTAQKHWLSREHRPLVDLFVAFNAMFFAGATFEGYLLARSFVPQLLLLIFSAFGVWIATEIRYNQEHTSEFVDTEMQLDEAYGSLAHE